VKELKGKTVLLVEDQAIIALAEKGMLETYGLSVHIAHSGEKAVQTATQNPDIDIVLMDIDLGTGMDGTEAAARIQETRDVPIVFLSSHTEMEYLQRTDDITSYGYIVKNSGEMVIIRSMVMALRLHSAHRMVHDSRRLIAEEERKYRLLFTNLTAGFALHQMIYNEEGNPMDYRFVGVNPAFERITGLHASEIVGKTVLEVLPGTERYWINTYAQVLETGKPIAYENYSAELDRYFDVWAFRHDTDMFATVISDITPRKQAARRVRETNTYLESVLESVQEGITVLEPDLTIQHANSTAQRWFPHPSGLVGKNVTRYSETELNRVRTAPQPGHSVPDIPNGRNCRGMITPR
jgi:PAS domain S-box-containing protein